MLKSLAVAASLLTVSTPAFAASWFHRAVDRAPVERVVDSTRHTPIDGHDLLHRELRHNQLLDLNNMNNPLSPLSPLNPMSVMNPINQLNQMNQMNQMNRMGRF